MKVSHHGSADPGLPEVLDRLEPKIAAIEVGAHNTYGHPTPSTLAALRRAGVPTYRTDEDGTVTLTVADGRMAVSGGALTGRPRRLGTVAELKPAYLVCGDDDAKIDAWRARVRRRAEDERGPGGLETFDARQSEPAEVAGALAMLSFETATRYLLVDDVGAWKAGELGPLDEAMGELPPDTVLVLVARGKAVKQLSKAVEKAGGETREYAAPKPWELPKWCIGHARELGLQLDPEAAKELVARVGRASSGCPASSRRSASRSIRPRTSLPPTSSGSPPPTPRPAPTTLPTPSWRVTSRRRSPSPSSSTSTARSRAA